MENTGQLLPDLFRREFTRMTSVIVSHYGLKYIELAEDLVSETFLQAAETWTVKGIPENPQAWLYKTAKNKTLDYLRRNKVFTEKISAEIKSTADTSYQNDFDFTESAISDSQLKMIFAVCSPLIPAEAQIGLALRILCGFGIEEIAEAFITNKETINKRLYRAKEKLRDELTGIELPAGEELEQRLGNVLHTIYLLFNEGYYTTAQTKVLRKSLCSEAMRLCILLTNYDKTNRPETCALLSLMCFHASRFDARENEEGEMVLYADQNRDLWDSELIMRGEYYLNLSAKGSKLSSYHIEASIAYWHAQKGDSVDKWKEILKLYNVLLQINYSPVVALNRTYALYRAQGREVALAEAKKLKLEPFCFYHVLLGELYTGIDNAEAMNSYKRAIDVAKNEHEIKLIEKRIADLTII